MQSYAFAAFPPNFPGGNVHDECVKICYTSGLQGVTTRAACGAHGCQNDGAGLPGAFRGLLGLGISGRIINLISLMNLIKLMSAGADMPRHVPTGRRRASFGMGSGYYDVVGGYFGYGIGVGLPLAWVGGTHLYKVHYGVVVAVREICVGVDQ